MNELRLAAERIVRESCNAQDIPVHISDAAALAAVVPLFSPPNKAQRPAAATAGAADQKEHQRASTPSG